MLGDRAVFRILQKKKKKRLMSYCQKKMAEIKR